MKPLGRRTCAENRRCGRGLDVGDLATVKRRRLYGTIYRRTTDFWIGLFDCRSGQSLKTAVFGLHVWTSLAGNTRILATRLSCPQKSIINGNKNGYISAKNSDAKTAVKRFSRFSQSQSESVANGLAHSWYRLWLVKTAKPFHCCFSVGFGWRKTVFISVSYQFCFSFISLAQTALQYGRATGRPGVILRARFRRGWRGRIGPRRQRPRRRHSGPLAAGRVAPAAAVTDAQGWRRTTTAAGRRRVWRRRRCPTAGVGALGRRTPVMSNRSLCVSVWTQTRPLMTVSLQSKQQQHHRSRVREYVFYVFFRFKTTWHFTFLEMTYQKLAKSL